MTKAGCLLNVVLFAILMFAITVGGPASSRACKKKYNNNVVKNGKAAKAIIVGKKSHKGRSVIFKYTFKGSIYKNSEQNPTYYKDLIEGDSVTILLDSTHPSESFITSY